MQLHDIVFLEGRGEQNRTEQNFTTVEIQSTWRLQFAALQPNFKFNSLHVLAGCCRRGGSGRWLFEPANGFVAAAGATLDVAAAVLAAGTVGDEDSADFTAQLGRKSVREFFRVGAGWAVE